MEQIGRIKTETDVSPRSNESQITQILSPSTPQRQNLGVSREKLTAMLDVLKARWQTKGFHAMDKADSEPMALAFIRELDRHSIPYQHYRKLYERSVDLRARRIAQGLKCDDFSVDTMVACWPQLKQDLYDQDVEAGRMLTATAATQCLRCYGTGLETIFDDDGKKLGVRPGCKHEHVDTSDPHSDGLDQAFEALRQPGAAETAIDICRRVQRDLAQQFLAANSEDESAAVWAASRTWHHAARYIRDVDSSVTTERG